MLTSELNIIKTNLTVYCARLGDKTIGNSIRFAIDLCSEQYNILLELILYQYVLSTWQQYEDGTAIPYVNYITQEDFNTIQIQNIKHSTRSLPFGSLSFDAWNLFVIWCLIFGISNSTYRMINTVD